MTTRQTPTLSKFINMNYKKVLSAGVSGFMVLSVISPSFAMAEGTDKAKSTTKENGFCNTLPLVEKNLNKNAEIGLKLDSKKNDLVSKMKDNWTNADTKREGRRTEQEANTAKRLKEKFSYIKTLYWGTDGIWSDGYFVSTVGVNEQVIKQYIENQGKEDTGQAMLELG